LYRLACVAGEPSGDLLVAPVLSALNQLPSMSEFEAYGIGGPAMQACHFDSRWPMETLSVRGYVEAIRQLPAILRLRQDLLSYLTVSRRPDVYLGIDAPDFNLGVEFKLRQVGIPTVHFVSPSIWAWRGSRIHQIKKAVSKMLCIFPFETAIYEQAGIPATYVGHPLASSIPLVPQTQEARKRIRLPSDALVIAVLPGSRVSEIALIGPIFFDTIAEIAQRLKEKNLYFVIPVAAPHLLPKLEQLRSRILQRFPNLQIILLDGDADTALESADLVLIASGTATLQAALWKKPMVISYKVPWLTAQIMKRQGYLPYVGLPNILAGEFVVPELLQDAATPKALANATLSWLDRPQEMARLQNRFLEMHESLRRPTALLAAQAIENALIDSKRSKLA